MSMKDVTVRVSDAEATMLDEIADAEGVSRDHVVGEFIRRTHSLINNRDKERGSVVATSVTAPGRPWVVSEQSEYHAGRVISRHASAFAAACRALSKARDDGESVFALYAGNAQIIAEKRREYHASVTRDGRVELLIMGTDKRVALEDVPAHEER